LDSSQAILPEATSFCLRRSNGYTFSRKPREQTVRIWIYHARLGGCNVVLGVSKVEQPSDFYVESHAAIPQRYFTESRQLYAFWKIGSASPTSTKGTVLNSKKGHQGAWASSRTAAVPVSTMATPPLPSAKE